MADKKQSDAGLRPADWPGWAVGGVDAADTATHGEAKRAAATLAERETDGEEFDVESMNRSQVLFDAYVRQQQVPHAVVPARVRRVPHDLR